MDLSIFKTISDGQERELLSWVMKKWGDGISILRKEPAYANMQKCLDYIDGKQLPLKQKAISTTIDNKVRKVVLEFASSLTDVRPIWTYQTHDMRWTDQGESISKLAKAWWRNNRVDRVLSNALIYASAGGTGYIALTWDPEAGGGAGDIVALALDPRDVIPIDPVFVDSVDSWRGVIVRQRMPVDMVRDLYPSKAYKINPSDGFALLPDGGRTGGAFDVISSAWDVLKRSKGGQDVGEGSRQVDLLRVYWKDPSVYTGPKPIKMGEGNYEYVVNPLGWIKEDGTVTTAEEAKLYPRGRMIVCTPSTILHDGPIPYWFGFPLIKFTPLPMPHRLLGESIVLDMLPLQDSLNKALQGLDDGIDQWIERGVVGDKQSISEHNLRALDTRRSGLKASLNMAAGEGFKLIDGPTFPTWYLEFVSLLKNEIDENTGVKGLLQLNQQKQMPSEDAIEKMLDALSPILRFQSRSIEISLNELADKLKIAFFQYYDVKRRVQVLGDDGRTLEDYDFDPGSMIPDDVEGETRMERGLAHQKNFTFWVEQNSFLNVSHMTQKMLILQLFRANGIDIYTLWEALDVPNIGETPEEKVPERMIRARKLGLQPGPTPEVVQAQEALTIAQAQAAMAQLQMQQQQMQMMQMQQSLPFQAPPGVGGGGVPPQNQEVRTNGVGPQGGRPPSGMEPPEFQLKDGGTRAVISESG